jgi:hypothetical protein
MISSHCGDLADMVPGSIAIQQQHQQCKGLRILLVGSCSQGSIAVWDVLHKQQVIAIHSPELQLFGLLPLQPQLPTPATCAADAARQPKQRRKQQQQQQCQPVVVALLALAAAKSSNNNAALVVDLPWRSAAVSEKRVEEQLHLRPILLQQPNCLCAGSPMLQLLQQGEHHHHHHHQQQMIQQPHAPSVGSSTSACDGHVTVATLSGRTAAAVLAGNGAVQVWDVITGQVITSASSAAGHPAAAASTSAAKVAAGERSGRVEALRVMLVPADECDEGSGGMSAASPGQHVLLMTGDTDGMMALTWL